MKQASTLPARHAAETGSTTASTADDVVAVPLRHPWRWIVAGALALGFVALFSSLWTNPNIDHDTISSYVFHPRILSGIGLTLVVTVVSMLVSTVLGVLLAVMRLSKNPVMNAFAWFYVWVFRGTPLLIQIVFWGYLGLLYSQISLGVPFTDFTVFSVDTNTLVPAFTAGLLAMTLNQAAYSAEIIRGGLVSVDAGQQEAAASLGMSPAYTLFRVVLPQAMRVIIPPMGNETISMLKNTSLLSVIAVLELYTVATQISSQNLRQVELLIVVSCWYLFLTSVLSVPQYYLERHYGRGNARQPGPTPLGRIVSSFRKGKQPESKGPVND
ncbi:amino acid ABC transporter permease [Arthrobacter crystallopoietes]|uniref:Amino acid ABC transporter membrane protein, PAAT family n=1 Tax=Crystallibacter crystallopoietes TaxID=37928 RepID=A0A1H0ZN11_9MICC|nr:amino acid ABC transporter permease [Arthrobacter crystallopoietes]AUI51896.1 ABC transporter permease [Arthrobacter crystallopoietes]SDQ28850.1 amino acid ABC transporter membrane protein, PAAT family [Arthrobacter crystallopoietes]